MCVCASVCVSDTNVHHKTRCSVFVSQKCCKVMCCCWINDPQLPLRLYFTTHSDKFQCTRANDQQQPAVAQSTHARSRNSHGRRLRVKDGGGHCNYHALRVGGTLNSQLPFSNYAPVQRVARYSADALTASASSQRDV